MLNSMKIYEKRNKRYENLLIGLKNTSNFISALRFIIFAATLIFTVYSFLHKEYYIAIIIFFIGLIIFIILMLKHNKVIKNRKLTEAILHINDLSLLRLRGEWKSFLDKGEEFINNEHNYAEDLDILGGNSLFQWINNAYTPLGRIQLKNRLCFPKLDKKAIYESQDAIKELSKKVGFRQELAAEGSFILTNKSENDEMFNWAEKANSTANKDFFKFIILLMPLITVISILLFLVFNVVGYVVPLIFMAVNLGILKLQEKQRTEILDTIYKYKKNLKLFYKMIKLIEEKNFHSKLLNEIKHEFIGDKFKASKAINKLSKISDKVSDRRNLFSILLNVIFLWDFHLIVQLDNWKKQYGRLVMPWLNAIGDMEALSSLSIIGFDNPEWTLPVIDNNLKVRAINTAHPLLPKDAVSNGVDLNKNSSIFLITGSNMSGKSTYLRTIGINLVLAYAGASVRAEEFSCGLMNIYTCMRISDNLEKSISSFYAEIIRIKKIVAAAKGGETVFFLLDEIFKGTNSLDRHIGAEALINMLSKENTLGIISTHDLELGDLENKNQKVENYNFQEYYKNNEIHFDYKLRKGISTTRNAKFLMKLAGIEFKE
ncbi:MutS family DNA mismatch repair protein [Candidatus Clostridium stratigraminis]|uniref:MutS-related protein n=1 Tax=Candidatus Clostridium stratigraminis TaxID=3381661 RepID=A0ABW8T726_9CLOT